MKRLWIAALCITFGCSEYQFSSMGEAYGEANPMPLKNPTRTERVVQVTSPAVDILWVVDNSCSMAEEQDELATNFHAFLNYFLDTALDFHIGVVSTDMDNPNHSGILQTGGGARWIEPSSEQPLEAFRNMTNLGTGGADMEKGRAATYAALEYRAEEENFGFIREDATLHVIVVSDEDDYSGADPIGLNPFIDFMLDYKGDPDMVTFSSIVGPPGGCGGGIFSLNYVEPGRDYIAVTEEVGGILHSICSDDWSGILDELGEQAAQVRLEYFLAALPVPGTIAVEVATPDAQYEFAEGTDWTYDAMRNSITFIEYVPPPLAEVFITYEELSASY